MENKNTKICEPNTGFVAGTLVHTKDGLVPIEKIKVGDWVLSKHENDQGDQAYKRVTQIFSHENQVVRLLNYSVYLPDGSETGRVLVATPNSPFRIPGKGWRKLKSLRRIIDRIPLETFNGSRAMICRNCDIYVSQSPDIAWICLDKPSHRGAYYDLIHHNVLMNSDNPNLLKSDLFGVGLKDGPRRPKENDLYRARVFNIAIEDFHTYYVDELGVWIRNE
jgi:hypothetical protein